MGLTERHWFENEEPELTERQLEDIVYENKRAYDSGYAKGYSDRDKEIVRCKDCKYGTKIINAKDEPMIDCVLMYDDAWLKDPDWFCADGKLKEGR